MRAVKPMLAVQKIVVIAAEDFVHQDRPVLMPRRGRVVKPVNISVIMAVLQPPARYLPVLKDLFHPPVVFAKGLINSVDFVVIVN